MNRIFGFVLSNPPPPNRQIPFKGTEILSKFDQSNNFKKSTAIFSSPNASISKYYSDEHRAHCYVWGIPSHPDVNHSAIPKWSIQSFKNKSYSNFKDLMGLFIIIIIEPEDGRVAIINDFMGIRPFFISQKNGNLIFGSEVWPIFESGLIEGKIDYNSLASFLYYGYNCTNGSLFVELARLSPGTITTFQNGHLDERSYLPDILTKKCEIKSDINKVTDDIHEMVEFNLKKLLSDNNEISFALSGGYDSRYLLAQTLSIKPDNLNIACVNYPEAEGTLALQVSKILNVPVSIITPKSSIWNEYDHPIHFSHDGFPITKHASFLVAAKFHPKPVINGFLGDRIIKLFPLTFFDKYENQYGEDLAGEIQKSWQFSKSAIFKRTFEARLIKRTLNYINEFVEKWKFSNLIIPLQIFYHRQRFYIANNFLQHMDISEPLLPFYSWPLFSYKFGLHPESAEINHYPALFSKYFHNLSTLGHSSYLPKTKQPFLLHSNYIQNYSKILLKKVLKKKDFPFLSHRYTLSSLLTGSIGLKRSEFTLLRLISFYMLENKVKQENLAINWNEI